MERMLVDAFEVLVACLVVTAGAVALFLYRPARRRRRRRSRRHSAHASIDLFAPIDRQPPAA
jgi:Tfp pilus assembly protein PilV